MSDPLFKTVSLAGPQGDGFNAYLNAEGAFYGPGIPLLRRRRIAGSYDWEPRSRAELEKLLAIGHGRAVNLGGQMDRLRAVAHAMNKGDQCLAAITLLHMALPPLPSIERAERMAKAAGLRKYEGQPRQTESANPGWFGPGKQGTSRLPMHDNGGPSAEDKKKNPKAEEQEKHVTPLVPLPEAKKEVFKNNDDWERFNDLVAERPGSNGTEQVIYPLIFAWEGGFDEGKNGAYGGITRSFLELAQAPGKIASAEKAVPGIGDVENPSDLSNEQVVRLYRWYFDDALQNVQVTKKNDDGTEEHFSGHHVLEVVGNPYAAAALADTLFNLGAPAATTMIIDAINQTLKDQGLPEISRYSASGQKITWISQSVFDAYKKLASNPDTCGQLLDNLKSLRDQNNIGDTKRHNFFAFASARND